MCTIICPTTKDYWQSFFQWGSIMNLYEIEILTKLRQNELDKELKRIRLLRSIKTLRRDIGSERWQNSKEKGMNILDYWIRFLYRVATGTRKTRKIFTPVGLLRNRNY